MKEQIKAWIDKYLPQTKSTGNTHDIYIEDWMDVDGLSKQELFDAAVTLFNEISAVAKDIDFGECDLALNIELEDGEDELMGKPKTYEELIDSIDEDLIPLVTLKKNTASNMTAGNESYTCPVFFTEVKTDGVLFYKEYKTTMDDNEPYTRNIDFVLKKQVDFLGS